MMKKLLLLSITVSFFGVLVVPHTTYATSFDRGHIIDDVVFQDKGTMYAAGIQDFLNSKVPSCDTNGTLPATEFGRPDLTHAQYAATRGWPSPPYTCLRDYAENGVTAAQIIYNLSQQYQINPQVLLVTLQKESSLITDTWPLPSQYQSATGYGCPDSGPNNSANCNSNYFGLTNQLTNTAYMYHAIMTQNPNWYSPYVVGTNYIQWSPNASCGGTNVNIVNWSTAALYDYTPYQPNAAALNAGYGVGDSCSAYGNRNFYLYFTSWFGPTYGNLVQAPGGGGVYLIDNGTKRPFPNEISFISNNYSWANMVTISATELNSLPTGTPVPYNAHYRDGKLIKAAGAGTYVIDNGTKRPFPNETTFFLYGYTYADASSITNYEMSLIPDGTPMPYNTHLRDGHLVRNSSGGMYVVDNGSKRPFPNETTFFSYGYTYADALPLSYEELGMIPDGTPMPMKS